MTNTINIKGQSRGRGIVGEARESGWITYPQPCQCEHKAHFEMEERTPNGNPGHLHRSKFLVLISIQTSFGIFKVCPDCAKDCFGKELTINVL